MQDVNKFGFMIKFCKHLNYFEYLYNAKRLGIVLIVELQRIDSTP